MSSQAPVPSPLRALKSAEAELAAARRAAAEAQAQVRAREDAVSAAHRAVEAARSSALVSVRNRSLLKAYALWLLFPLVWPGAYLFYLGRDTHAWLNTVSFGGFGIGWLLDLFYIPLYVRDHNEPPGYFDGVERRHKRWFSLSGLLLAPLSLGVQFALAIYFGINSSNLY